MIEIEKTRAEDCDVKKDNELYSPYPHIAATMLIGWKWATADRNAHIDKHSLK
jgi:hypothetical protein